MPVRTTSITRKSRGTALLVALALVVGAGCSRDEAAPAPPPGTVVPTTANDPCRDRGRASPGSTTLAIADLVPPSGPASITGTITDGTCGTPVPGIKVLLVDEVSQTKLIGATTTTTAGTYAFPSVATGRYRLELFDPTSTYVTSFFRASPDFDEAEPIDLQAAFTYDERMWTVAEQPVPEYEGAAGGKTIAVIGDSLVQQTTGALREKLSAIGPTSVRGISLQRTDQMLPVAEKFARTAPDMVIIALGNNDLLEQRPAIETVRHLQDLVDLFPRARCVFVLNINSHTGQDEFNERANEVNLDLLRLSVERPQVKLVDWDADVRLLLTQGVSPGAWFSDTLHLTALGAGAYATAMETAVKQCL